MQVAKWGNSLAVRLPAALVQELGLKAGDEVDVATRTVKKGAVKLELARQPTRAEIIEGLRKHRGLLPAGYRFKRADGYDEKRGGG